jgi:hypothetical protein
MLLSYWQFCLLHAGVFISYTKASLFIVMADCPLLPRIFRQDPDPSGIFYVHGFFFDFAGGDDEDIFYYISCDDFRMTFYFFLIDTTANCDTSSNLVFVLFI